MKTIILFGTVLLLNHIQALDISRLNLQRQVDNIFVDFPLNEPQQDLKPANNDNDNSGAKTSLPPPPPHTEEAKLARYITHYSNWGSMATTCTREPLVGYPFSNVFSLSDGKDLEHSSGIPYFYFTDMEMSVQDLNVDNRATLSMTLAQGDYCKKNELDAQDPPCARLILSGRTVKIQNGTKESDFAKDALFARHPNMADYPDDHGFYFAKLDIERITLLAYFGGAKHVSLEDYFNAKLTKVEPQDQVLEVDEEIVIGFM